MHDFIFPPSGKPAEYNIIKSDCQYLRKKIIFIPKSIWTAFHDTSLARRRMKLIKSFCRGPGGSFFKKRPLAAGGKKSNFMLGEILCNGQCSALLTYSYNQFSFGVTFSKIK